MYEKYIGYIYSAIGCVLLFEEIFFGVLHSREPLTFFFIFVIIVFGQILTGIGCIPDKLDKKTKKEK